MRTQIVWGRDDALISAAYAGEFAAAITGSKVAIIDVCGHIAQVEKHDETVGVQVVAFVRSVARRVNRRSRHAENFRRGAEQ